MRFIRCDIRVGHGRRNRMRCFGSSDIVSMPDGWFGGTRRFSLRKWRCKMRKDRVQILNRIFPFFVLYFFSKEACA